MGHVQLFLIDEVHVLGEERGAVLETVRAGDSTTMGVLELNSFRNGFTVCSIVPVTVTAGRDHLVHSTFSTSRCERRLRCTQCVLCAFAT
jgi:hypothetical protein